MWRLFVEETVKNQGMDFVAAKGNHDMDGWDDISGLWSDPQKGYAAQLTNLKPGECYGAYGEDMTCDYGGVTIVVSDVGVDQAGESANKQKYDYIDNALRNSKNKWKICVWHMNQEDMQVSYKGDSVGWGAYEICRKHGAFIVNGHAHTYSRTKEMRRFGSKPYSFTNKDLQIADAVQSGTQPSNVIHLSSGEASGSTGVAVVGFGGYKNEPQLKSATHWAKIYSSECIDGDIVCEVAPEDSKYGALMCDFPETGDTAECWVVTTVKKDATRREKRAAYRNPVDRFFLVNGKGGNADAFDLDAVMYADPTEDASDDPISEDSSDDYTTGRTLSVASNKKTPGGVKRTPGRHRRRFDGNLDRSTCVDFQPPEHGCAQQKKWGKCDAYFMTSKGLCAKTCGRCVATPSEPKDYDDDYVVDDDSVADDKSIADDDDSPAPAPSALDDVDFAAIADDVLGMMDGDDVNGMIDTYETLGER